MKSTKALINTCQNYSVAFFSLIFTDMIDIDIENQRIHLSVGKEEIQERLKRWRPPLVPEHYRRSYVKMCIIDFCIMSNFDHITIRTMSIKLIKGQIWTF